MIDYNWLSKRTYRSVDTLRLWSENPRLNPEDSHIYISDFVEDLISDAGERESFCNLIKSISENGFIPSDPIVVWKNTDNEKFYVAEGNRRVLALKLLRDPNKAPKSIRGLVRKYSTAIDKNLIKKVLVSIAPSFDDVEWYINQRNNASSLQKSWSRVQQQRWIASLYEKYKGDIDKILSITSMNKSDIEAYIRILKIKDFIKIDDVKRCLTQEEYDKANSHRFPITILERFFGYSIVKERWNLEYNGTEIVIHSELSSFYKAFAELIRRILSDGDDKIDTRIKAEDAIFIIDSLPPVIKVLDDTAEQITNNIINHQPDIIKTTGAQEIGIVIDSPTNIRPLKNNPDRNRILLPIYEITTSDTRLLELFEELKRIPLSYKNCVSAAMRIFLDLTVRNYIQSEGIEDELCKKFKCSFNNVTLHQRLSYLKDNSLTGNSKKVAERLLNSENEFSLDVLNGYVHGSSTHYLSKQFLNRFWDSMFPLFEQTLEIKEI